MGRAGRWAERAATRKASRYLGLGLSVAGILIAVLVQSRAQPASEETAVLTADTALADAMRNGDKSVARRLLSLQFTYADADGKIYERKEFLDDLKSASALAPADAKANVYGQIATVTGHRKSVQTGDTFFIDIWAKQKGSWRALTMQDVAVGTKAPPAQITEAKSADCTNPCQTIPYRVRSPAEQDVVNTFQAITRAEAANDFEEWQKHIGSEFMLFRSGRPAESKPVRAAAMERDKKDGRAETIDPIEAMRLSVYGDGASMIATQTPSDRSRPAFRAARVWSKRNGQWQLVINVQTDIKPPPP